MCRVSRIKDELVCSLGCCYCVNRIIFTQRMITCCHVFPCCSLLNHQVSSRLFGCSTKTGGQPTSTDRPPPFIHFSLRVAGAHRPPTFLSALPHPNLAGVDSGEGEALDSRKFYTAWLGEKPFVIGDDSGALPDQAPITVG